MSRLHLAIHMGTPTYLAGKLELYESFKPSRRIFVHPFNDSPRPLYAGPDDGPQSPFPVKVSGRVIKGFGRGSKELGIPTANIPVEGLSIGGHEDLSSGVYFGWAGLDVSPKDLAQRTNEENGKSEQVDIKNTSTGASTSTNRTTTTTQNRIFPMVMSIGWNPFYKNTVRSVEVHIITPTPFPSDFYGAHLALVILGFIRPEYDYVSVEALVADIRTDIDVATRSLTTRPAYQRWKGDAWLLGQICNHDDDADDRKIEEKEEKETRDVVR